MSIELVKKIALLVVFLAGGCIHVKNVAMIKGVVTDVDGTPVSGIYVFHRKGNEQVIATTDPCGGFNELTMTANLCLADFRMGSMTSLLDLV